MLKRHLRYIPTCNIHFDQSLCLFIYTTVFYREYEIDNDGAKTKLTVAYLK